MTARSVQEWFEIIQSTDDQKLARQVLGRLIGYHPANYKAEGQDIANLTSLFTAIRLDQMAKENRSTP